MASDRLFKESVPHKHPEIRCITNIGYIGIKKFHENALHPKKQRKWHPLTQEDKAFSCLVSKQQVLSEHMIGLIKRFKIVADMYKNRRTKFSLRFNLIVGICNFELTS